MGNNISANTLFHFTNSLDNIESILVNDFYPRYCLEDQRLFFPEDSPLYDHLVRAIPMVCFCDIPLSQIGNHISMYGGYGIGLTKKWGEMQNISPVMYITPNANSTLTIKDSYSNILENYKNVKDEKTFKVLCSHLTSLVAYIKQYTGNSINKTNSGNKEIIFYDEREWRYVPKLENLNIAKLKISLSKKSFEETDKRDAANSAISMKCKLAFQPKDIKYIIVKHSSEILPMVEKIEKAKGNKYTWEDVKLLSTRIIPLEQVLSDF